MAFKMRKTPYPMSSPAKQTNEERLLEIKRQRALLNNKKEFEEKDKDVRETRALTKDELKSIDNIKQIKNYDTLVDKFKIDFIEINRIKMLLHNVNYNSIKIFIDN